MINDFENDLYNAILDATRDVVREYTDETRGVIQEYADEFDWDDMEFSIQKVFREFSENKYAMMWLYKIYNMWKNH